jgi:hypothetical protein
VRTGVDLEVEECRPNLRSGIDQLTARAGPNDPIIDGKGKGSLRLMSHRRARR